MNLSNDMRSDLVTELRLIKDRMIEEEILAKKIWWYSGAYGMVFRVLNFEYDPDLQFLHQMLQSSYKAISNSISNISAGKSSITLPSDIGNRLASLLESLADRIEEDETFYDELRTISNLNYLTTGNGYFLSLKGIEVAPRIRRGFKVYRRKIESHVWHWCTNCSTWPKVPVSYTEREFRDPPSTLCHECLNLDKEDDCICAQVAFR